MKANNAIQEMGVKRGGRMKKGKPAAMAGLGPDKKIESEPSKRKPVAPLGKKSNGY